MFVRNLFPPSGLSSTLFRKTTPIRFSFPYWRRPNCTRIVRKCPEHVFSVGFSLSLSLIYFLIISFFIQFSLQNVFDRLFLISLAVANYSNTRTTRTIGLSVPISVDVYSYCCIIPGYIFLVFDILFVWKFQRYVRNDENGWNGKDGERRDVLKNVSTKRINQRRPHAAYWGPDGERHRGKRYIGRSDAAIDVGQTERLTSGCAGFWWTIKLLNKTKKKYTVCLIKKSDWINFKNTPTQRFSNCGMRSEIGSQFYSSRVKF